MERSGLENVEDVYPLTPIQQGMVFHTIADPASGIFVTQISTELLGELDSAAFRASWADLVDRHSVLRTAFVWDGLDEPLQVVREKAELEWVEHDWSALSVSEQRQRLDTVLLEDRHLGFDLAAAPLSRMMLLRTGTESWWWVWSMHHIIADGWSTQILIEELVSIYRARRRGLPPALDEPFRYRDFVADQTRRNTDREEEFWRRYLSGFSSPHRLEVPGMPPPRGAAGRGSHTVTVDAATTAAVRSMAGAERVTLNIALAGAWALLMSRWTRERDVVFGVTTAGRDASLRGIERGVGLFLNTLPQRVAVPPESRLGEWLRNLQMDQRETRTFEQSSLASVQRWSEIPPGDALFESIFVFENVPVASGSRAAEGLEVGDMQYIDQSNYPLAVLVIPGEVLSVSFVYDKERFAPAAIESLGRQMTHLLGQFVRAADQRLSSFDVVTSEDVERLRAFDAGPAAPTDERCVHEIIEAIAGERPAAAAAVFEGRTISYGELDAAANQVAARLRAAGVVPNQPVGLYLPRSIELIVGMLGILKAGGAYVPLDPTYPPGHIQSLLEGDAIEVVLTISDLMADVSDMATVVAIDDESTPPDASLASAVRVTNDDLAYVIHTSGSTGRPKGVMVTHRNLVASTLARVVHYGDPVGRFLLLSSFAFDSSVAGIFWTLCTGGTLVLPTPKLEQDVDRLLGLAAEHQVTHLLCLPALYQLLLEHAKRGELSFLEVAIVAGESCPPGVFEAHAARVPEAELHNEYGPTEATVWCTVHRASDADIGRPLPIGRPIAGAKIHLLDQHGNRVPPGFAGELCVSGAGVAAGYLNRPDLTAERFTRVAIDDSAEQIYLTGDLACYRSDGAAVFLGRVDSQMKVRGHRIERGAVEKALLAQPMVREAAVAARHTAGRSTAQLVAYLVCDDGFDAQRLRNNLRSTLPAFMVPDVFIPLVALPRLPNGKVDHGALPDPTPVISESEQFVPLSSDTELALAAIWGKVLGVNAATIGADSDFFALGGDSLHAIRLMSAVHQHFGTSLPLSSLLDAPVLGDLARQVRTHQPGFSVLVPIREGELETLFMIHPGGGNVLSYQPLARHLPDSVRVVGVQAHGVDGSAEPDHSMDAMARRYADEIAAYLPTGTVHLVGHSTGGLIAYETARLLERAGRQVGLVVMLDTMFPFGSTLLDRIRRAIDTVRAGKWLGVRTVAFWVKRTLGLLRVKLRYGPQWAYLRLRGRRVPPALAGMHINDIAASFQTKHRPGAYAGTVTYIRATGDAERVLQDSVERWRSVARQVIEREAPGRHTGPENLIKEPHARASARLIAEELASQHRPDLINLFARQLGPA